MDLLFLQTANEAADKASDILRHYWGNIHQIEHKSSSSDLVTEADKASEKAILSLIRQNHPDHSLLAEESGSEENPQSGYCWVVDPLDGTTNFTHQYPMVSISIALLKEGKPILALIDHPILKERFIAVKGEGATLNGQPIHVSKNPTLEKSLLATGFSYDRNETDDNNYKEFCRITSLSQGVRRLGSAALDLAYVAAGRLDGFWERGLGPWDMAAGWLLVQEAGGTVTDYDGTDFELASGRVLASNGILHEELKRALRSS